MSGLTEREREAISRASRKAIARYSRHPSLVPAEVIDEEVGAAVERIMAERAAVECERAVREAVAAVRFETVGEVYGDGWNAACDAILRAAPSGSNA